MWEKQGYTPVGYDPPSCDLGGYFDKVQVSGTVQVKVNVAHCGVPVKVNISVAAVQFKAEVKVANLCNFMC